MSNSNLSGKKKADLVAIAAISGLLSEAEARKMTKADLLDFLKKAEDNCHKQQSEDTDTEESTDKTQGEPQKTVVSEVDDEPISEPEELSQKSSVENDTATENKAEEKPASKSSKKTKSDKSNKPAKKNDKKSTKKNKSRKQTEETEIVPEPEAEVKEAKEVEEKEELEVVTGVLEIMQDGYGFLRRENYLQGTNDVYVPPQFIRRFSLRNGDLISGPVKAQRDSDRYKALCYINEVNDEAVDKSFKRPRFDRLTPIYPNERYRLETVHNEYSTRIIDLVAPVGKGQRAMIVSPPKAGKTILMQKIANAISANNPDAKLIVLLIDERPEEVTDMQRSIQGEVVYSTFDKTPENHVKVTELVLERAMRLVELGKDVVILLDSITRMARAYNLTINPTGRTLSGGLDPGALYGPKRFFGAARNIENGGSLTIIATALVETGSRMDEVIFEEFKGTGNMEVYLDRKLADKRIFPALDLMRSGTRREDLLLSKKELDANWALRKAFGQLESAAVTQNIINMLNRTKDNKHFISTINVSFNDKSLQESLED